MKIEIDNNHAGRLKRLMPDVFAHKDNVQQRLLLQEIVDELLEDFCSIAEIEQASEQAGEKGGN